MAGAALRTAVARFGQLAVRTDASLAMKTPEQPVVAGRHCEVGLSRNELAFPTKRRAKIRMTDVEAVRFADHNDSPDADFNIARFTATRASCTL